MNDMNEDTSAAMDDVTQLQQERDDLQDQELEESLPDRGELVVK